MFQVLKAVCAVGARERYQEPNSCRSLLWLEAVVDVNKQRRRGKSMRIIFMKTAFVLAMGLALVSCETLMQHPEYIGHGIGFLEEVMRNTPRLATYKSVAPEANSKSAIRKLAVAVPEMDEKSTSKRTTTKNNITVKAASSNFAYPLRDFLMTVENLVGYRFDWYVSPNCPDVAMAFPGGVIVVNPNIASQVSEPALLFIHLHECGHQILGHTSAVGQMTRFAQPWLVPQMELDADRFAVETLLQAGVHPSLIEYAALEIFSASQATPSHPSGDQRLAQVRALLGQ